MRTITLVASITILLGLLAGCSGGDHAPRTPARQPVNAVMTITWPTRGRLIPQQTQSITITIKDAQGALIDQQTAARPTDAITSTVQLGAFAGWNVVSAVAYPTADGTGTPLALKADVGVNAITGQPLKLSIIMDSTITRLAVTAPTNRLTIGKTLQCTATAYDAQDRIVLTTPNQMMWDSLNDAVATVDNTGVVTAKSTGAAVITATDGESLMEGQLAFTVSVPKRVKYEYVSTLGFGTAASAVNMQFGNTTCIQIAPNGEVWVEDTNDGIHRFAPTGTYLGTIKYPADIAYSSSFAFSKQGQVYVVSSLDSAVYSLDDSNTFTKVIDASSEALYSLMGITTTGDGNIFLSDNSGGKVLIYNEAGNLVRTKNQTEWSELAPVCFATDNKGFVYMTDTYTGYGYPRGYVVKMLSNGDTVGTWSTDVSPLDGGISSAGSIAVDNLGHVLVTDYQNKRVDVFTDQGELLTTFNAADALGGSFDMPQGIAADANGNVYVGNRGWGSKSRVMKFRMVPVDDGGLDVTVD